MLKDKKMPTLSDKLYGQPTPIKEVKPKKAKAEKVVTIKSKKK